MKLRLLPLVVGAAATLAATAAAQLTPTPQLVGWTNAPLLPSSGSIDWQDEANGCQPAKRLCSGVLMHHVLSHAGGTAYDARHQSVWVSDGRLFEERALPGCETLCKATPMLMNKDSVVTGLAVSDHRRMLYQLESAPGYLGILPYFNSSCPPAPTRGGCNMVLRFDEIAAGLAYDEVRDLLFYTVTTPVGPTVRNTLYIAPASSACQPICKIALDPCASTALGLVTGLGYDPCARRLYVTDGRTTRWFVIVDPLKCEVKPGDCCAKQLGGAWAGLDVIPGWSQQRSGKSCLPKGCPLCASMGAALGGGDPSLGNPDFAVRIASGPAGRFALLVLGGGPCSSGLQLPMLCGPFYPSLQALVVLPPVQLMGTSVCGGEASVPLSIPWAEELCGLGLCVQWIVACDGGLFGATEAIAFRITG